MSRSRKDLEDRVNSVLKSHLGLKEVPEIAVRMLTGLFVSALMAASENRIGRAFAAEKSNADRKLRELAHLLKRAEKAFSELNPLAQELLARDKVGLLDLSYGELDQYFWSGANMGSSIPVKESIEQLVALRQSAERAVAALEGKVEKFGPGAPPKDGALAVAQICALAFEAYVGRPVHPTWNDHSRETEGRFFLFVDDVFAAGNIRASSEEYSRQAIEWTGKINTDKN